MVMRMSTDRQDPLMNMLGKGAGISGADGAALSAMLDVSRPLKSRQQVPDATSAKPSGLPASQRKKRHYQALFISDTHLGTRGAQVDILVDFLKNVSCDTLYMVGDIIDGWRLKKAWYWDTTHNDAIRRVLKMAKNGTRVVYIPGNHDEGFRAFVGNNIADVELKMDDVYVSVSGKKYWVLHGDIFDGVVMNAKWLAHLGDWAYAALLRLNTGLNFIRRKLGYSYWSLSAYLKHKVKNAVEYIGRFEDSVAAEARRRGVDGVICGHIHHAEQRMIDGIEYKNDGDWVESCTALAETPEGTWEIIYYADEIAAKQAKKAAKKARRLKAKKAQAAAQKKKPKQPLTPDQVAAE